MTKVLVLGLALGLLALAPGAQEKTPGPLELALDELDSGAAREQVVSRIRGLGEAVAPEALDLLAHELLSGPESGSDRARVLLAAAPGLGRAAFAPLWTPALASEEPGARLAAIRLIGATGGASDLSQAIESLASEPDARGTEMLEEAAVALLTRQPGALSDVRSEICRAPVELADRLIRAAARTPGELVPVMLVDLLGIESRLDLPLLSQLASWIRRHQPILDESWAPRVRPFLGSGQREVVRAALDALAALADSASLEDFLDLSEQDDVGLSRAAFAALRAVSGMNLPDRTERWRSWLAAERHWQETRAPRLVATLRGADEAGICSALRELAQHRIDRHRQARLAERLLDHPGQNVRIEACRMLAAVGPGPAREALERVTEDPVPAVASAAREALGLQPLEDS
jgi:HEAT repeat protein